MPANCHPLVVFLLTECNRQQLSLVELSRRSGVGYDTFKSWRTRCCPLLTHIEAALNVLGYKLTPTAIPDDALR